MKITITILSIALILMSSCKKDKTLNDESISNPITNPSNNSEPFFILMGSDTISKNTSDLEVVIEESSNELIVNVLSDFTVGSNTMQLSVDVEWNTYTGLGSYSFSQSSSNLSEFDNDVDSYEIDESISSVSISHFDSQLDEVSGVLDVTFLDGTVFKVVFNNQ